jgi:hypothetical protein
MYVWRVQFPPNPTEEGSVKQQGQPWEQNSELLSFANQTRRGVWWDPSLLSWIQGIIVSPFYSFLHMFI